MKSSNRELLLKTKEDAKVGELDNLIFSLNEAGRNLLFIESQRESFSKSLNLSEKSTSEIGLILSKLDVVVNKKNGILSLLSFKKPINKFLSVYEDEITSLAILVKNLKESSVLITVDLSTIANLSSSIHDLMIEVDSYIWVVKTVIEDYGYLKKDLKVVLERFTLIKGMCEELLISNKVVKNSLESIRDKSMYLSNELFPNFEKFTYELSRSVISGDFSIIIDVNSKINIEEKAEIPCLLTSVISENIKPFYLIEKQIKLDAEKFRSQLDLFDKDKGENN